MHNEVNPIIFIMLSVLHFDISLYLRSPNKLNKYTVSRSMSDPRLECLCNEVNSFHIFKLFKRSVSLLQTDAASGMRHYCGVRIELLEMGDEGDWECDIVHEDTSTTSFQATMETIPKSGNIPAAVGPGTSTRSIEEGGGSPFASTPSSTNTGTNH